MFTANNKSNKEMICLNDTIPTLLVFTTFTIRIFCFDGCIWSYCFSHWDLISTFIYPSIWKVFYVFGRYVFRFSLLRLVSSMIKKLLLMKVRLNFLVRKVLFIWPYTSEIKFSTCFEILLFWSDFSLLNLWSANQAMIIM